MDHLHNDNDQQKADEATNTFANPVGVLSATLDADLNAQKQLADTVAAADQKLHETLLADLTTSLTWDHLRLRLLDQLGVPAYASKGNGQVTATPLTFNERNAELDARLVLREQKVAAIAHVMALIGNARAASVAQATQELTNQKDSLNKLPAGSPIATSQTALNRTQWTACLLENIISAASNPAVVNTLATSANVEQKKLLAAIQNSKDPSTASALVGIVGSSLDDNSFTLLDNYLQALTAQLNALKATTPPKSDGRTTVAELVGSGSLPAVGSDLTNVDPDIAWDSTIDEFARTLASLSRAGDVIDAELHATTAVDDSVYKSPAVRALSLLPEMRPQAASGPGIRFGGVSVSSQGRTATVVAPISERLTSRSLTSELVLRELSSDQDNGNVEVGLARLGGAAGVNAASSNYARWQATRQDLGSAIISLDLGASRTASAVRSFKAAMPSLSAQTSAVLKSAASTSALPIGKVTKANTVIAAPSANASTTSPSTLTCSPVDLNKLIGNYTGDPTASSGLSFLQKALAGQPQLLNQLFQGLERSTGSNSGTQPGPLTDADLMYIGSLVSGIVSQGTAAEARVQQLLVDLYQIQLDLNTENVRHDQAMLAIANIEFKRWFTLDTLNHQYARVLASQKFDKANANTYPLFDDSRPDSPENASQWYKVATTLPAEPKPATNTTSTYYAHPSVKQTDSVFTSMIELTQTAKLWHGVYLRNGIPLEQDNGGNFGNMVDVADRRLYLGVRTVQGHLLMAALDRQASEQNVNRLTNELGVHDNQLDDFTARVEEANLRMRLGNLQAYHASGISSADIQTALQGVQDALIFYTAYTIRVHK